MSSNLKVNTILPSTGTAIGIGTLSGNVDVLGHIVGHNTPNISGINSVTASHFYGDGSNLTGLSSDLVNDTSPQLGANLDTNTKCIDFGDSNTGTVNRLRFGASTDFEIFHNGTNNHIDCHTAGQDLYIRPTKDVYFQDYNTDDIFIKMIKDGAVELYHNDVSMLETESRGAFVKKGNGSDTTFTVGSTDASGVRICLDGDSNGDAYGNDYAFLQHDSSGDFIISADNPAGNSNLIFKSGNSSERARIDSSGRLLMNGAVSGNAFAGGDDIVIGNTSARSGITLVSSTSDDGGLYFSKGTSSNSDYVMGQIVYQHDNNGGYLRQYTNASERLRIDSSGHVSLRNNANSHQEIQWYVGNNKSASIGWGNGSANWEFKHFRADAQADNPYANIDFFTGSTTSPTRALRITEDGNHIREKHSRFATRIAYTSGNEAANSKIPFHSAHVNVGGDYSDANDRFTAPVDGDYAFWFHTNVMKSGSGSYFATWYKNGSEANANGGRMYDQYTGSGWNNLSGCIMLNLSEGDYVEVYNGTVVANYDGNSYGQWMGWLVG